MASRRLATHLTLLGCGGFVALTTWGLISAQSWVKQRRAQYDAPRIALLRKVIIAQLRFHRDDPDNDGVNDYGNRDELIRAGLLTPDEVERAGKVTIEPVASRPKEHWWAVADPVYPGQGKAWFVNQGGVLHFAATPATERVDRKTGKPPEAMKIYSPGSR